MATTVSQIEQRARFFTNDSDPIGYRTSTEDMERLVNDGIMALWNMRPDLFVGQYASPPDGSLTGNAPLPFEDLYAAALVDYVAARASLVDDESVLEARASKMLEIAILNMGGQARG